MRTVIGASTRQVAALMWFTILMGSREGYTDQQLFTRFWQY
jgi:hypothetical protein